MKASVVEFRDIFPIPSTQAVRVTLYWPPEVALKSLHAERRSSPAVASEMESGDELYHRGPKRAALYFQYPDCRKYIY